MLKIAVLGIGNAGNQVANLSKANNIDTFCVNTSERDLDTIDQGIPVFLFGNSEGAGKDRTVAKNYVKSQYSALLNNEIFDSFITDKDIVFIVSSTGGGTGSGVSIILADILSRVYQNKVFINIGILPMLSESIGAQRNTLEFFKELKNLNKSYMLYDNNKYKNLSVNECMKKVNSEIIDMMKYIRGDYSYQSSYGMIDDADMYKILTVPGMINVSAFENFMEKDMEDNVALDAYMTKIIRTNATCTLDTDRIIKRMGVITNISKGLTKYYDASFKAFKENIGEPVEIFEHYFVSTENEIPNRYCVILSGLSIPDDRINVTLQRIKEVEEALARKKESSLIDSIDSLDGLKVESMQIDRNKSKEKKDIKSIDLDFMNQY